jgi:hypothetical protein
MSSVWSLEALSAWIPRSLRLRGMGMSIKAMNWCRELNGLSGTQKSILMHICDRYNDEFGYAWPSISRMARDTGWGDRTITRTLRSLESRNLIACFRQFYAHDGSPASNRYYLPCFGAVPHKGQVFLVGGSFDYEGTWEPDFETDQSQLWERYGLTDTTY